MTKGGPGDSSTTFATWSYRLGFGNLLPEFGPGRRRRQPPHRHRPGLRPDLHPGAAEPGVGMIQRTVRHAADAPPPGPATAPAQPTRRLEHPVGVVLTAIMLFPVYWMVNVSFTRDRRHAADARRTWFPFDGDPRGLPRRARPATAVPGHQPAHRARHRRADPGRWPRPAGYALAKLRPRGGRALSFVLLIAQMIPGIIMAMGFYAIYPQPRRTQQWCRA